MNALYGFSYLFQSKQKSVICSLNAKVKIFWFLNVIILSLVLKNIRCLFLLFLLTFIYSYLARAIRIHLLVVRRMFFFSVISLLLMLTVSRDADYLMGTLLHILSKVFIIASAGILFALTTSPHELIFVLDRLHIPKMFTFPLTIAIKFIPVFIKEVREIADSLKLRGMGTTFRCFLRYPRLWYRGIFIPLTIRSIKISDELAAAAESRGFGTPCRRTSFKEGRFIPRDYIFLFTSMIAFVGLLILEYRLKSSL